jgi:hypothetical protein
MGLHGETPALGLHCKFHNYVCKHTALLPCDASQNGVKLGTFHTLGVLLFFALLTVNTVLTVWNPGCPTRWAGGSAQLWTKNCTEAALPASPSQSACSSNLNVHIHEIRIALDCTAWINEITHLKHDSEHWQ